MSEFVFPQRVEAFCKSLQVSPHLLLSLRQMMRCVFTIKAPVLARLHSHLTFSLTHTLTLTLS